MSLFDEMVPVAVPPRVQTPVRPAGTYAATSPQAPTQPFGGRAFLVARESVDAVIREVIPGTNGHEYDRKGAWDMATRMTVKRHKKNKPTKTGRVFFVDLTGERRQVEVEV
jgi:hypothetical protein